jgi:CheY-like chemotaxis protein
MNFETNAILVVDDTELVAYFVGQLVGRMGFRAVLASNGQEALDRLTEEQFVAIISDVEMPVMGGFELARKLRLLYPELPVVLISALFDEERHRTALACGASDLLEKPVTASQLAAALCLFPPSHAPLTVQSAAQRSLALTYRNEGSFGHAATNGNPGDYASRSRTLLGCRVARTTRISPATTNGRLSHWPTLSARFCS